MKTLTNDQIISARRMALLLWQLKVISSREFGKICTRAERRRWEGKE